MDDNRLIVHRSWGWLEFVRGHGRFVVVVTYPEGDRGYGEVNALHLADPELPVRIDVEGDVEDEFHLTPSELEWCKARLV